MNKQEELVKAHRPKVCFSGGTLPHDEVEVLRDMLLFLFAKYTRYITGDATAVQRETQDINCKIKRRRILFLLETLEGNRYPDGDDPFRLGTIAVEIDGETLCEEDLTMIRNGLISYARECKNCEHQRIANRLRNSITLPL